ncbi:MAG: 4Fe-4S dicluster domain-containing protein, partial [Clostridia bacterium]
RSSKLRVPQLSFPQEIKPFLTIVKWYCVFYILFNDLCKVCPIQYFTVPATGYTSNTSNWAWIWAVVMVVFCTLSDRAACRVCPIGALTGIFNRISGARIKKCGAACTHCRACLEACPMDIQAIYEDRENEDVTFDECLYCMKCIEVCPEKGALRFDLFGKTILESRREVKVTLGGPVSIPDDTEDNDG